MRLSARGSAPELFPADLDFIYGAAERGDTNTLRNALRSGGTINFIHPKTTDSPLMIACRRGHQDVVKLCLDYGAKNDAHPDYGQTALHAAVASGRLPCAAILLEVAQASDADVIIANLTDQYGQTPLHTASIIGSASLAELLLHHGARVSSIDNYGQTPLHLCSGSGHKAVLAVLLDHGGDSIIDLPDVYGSTPLHHAAFHGKLDCAKLLLETAASVAIRNSEGLTAYHLANMHGRQQISALILEYRGGGYFGGAEVAVFRPPEHSLTQTLDRFSRDTTPMNGYHSDSPYGTPLVKGEFSARKPELRRSATDPYSMGTADLPRPHTVSSPAVGSKPGQTQARSRLNSLSSSPRADAGSPYSDGGPAAASESYDAAPKDPEGGDVYGGYRVVSQLSTPLVVREKRSTQMHSFGGSSSDNRFVGDVSKVFSGPKVVEPSPGHHQRLSAQATGTPQRTYSISSDSSNDDGHRLVTPERRPGRSPVKPASAQSANTSALEGEVYAEPLEVFECLDSVWNVYMTEEGDMYYLDMTSSHSQWDDPRIYGVIASEAYDAQLYDGPSPSKQADFAPPFSPMRVPSSGSGRADEKGRTPIRFLFSETDDGDGATTIATGEGEGDGSPVEPVSLQSTHAWSGSSLLVDSPPHKASQAPGEVSEAVQEQSQSLFVEEVSVASAKAKLAGLFAKEPALARALEPAARGELAARKEEWESSAKVSTATHAAERALPPKPISLLDESRGSSIVQPVAEPEVSGAFCQKYAEMVRRGQTLQEVRTLLESEGHTVASITKVMAVLDDCLVLELDELGPLSPKTPAASKVSVAAPTAPADIAQLQKDRLNALAQAEPSIAKYVKIVNMGALPMSVVSKMKMEGVPAALVEHMLVALGHGPTAKEEKKELQGWQPMPEERMKNSIWAFASLAQANEALLAEQELAELEQMFRTEREARGRPHHEKLEAIQASTKQAMALRVLEGKRAQNISIGLVAFKACGSHGDLLKAVCGLNTLEGRLCGDRLENLRSLLPTEAEVKLSFRLQAPTHPAEVFMQAALLFYPELPVRLATFISCEAFPDHVTALERKFRTIMDASNQVLSSTKLAKILQKLLVVGRVMMQPGKGARALGAGGDGKLTVLDQLLQISTTKAADKKTSVLDYVVKTLYDKGEEGLLGVIEDLSVVADATAPLSSAEALHDLATLQKTLAALEQELSRAQSLVAAHDAFSSPTAKAISDTYVDRLVDHLQGFRDRMGMLLKRKQLLAKKLSYLLEYFGEDPRERDSAPIFSALKEFRRALGFSKEAVEWRIHRSSAGSVTQG